MKLKFLVISLILATAVFAKDIGSKESKTKDKSLLGALYTPNKDQILGELLKGTLENYHLSQKKINNNLSRDAFKMYLEKIDYGKQFLTKKDISKLEKFEDEFDDQLKTGDLSIVRMSSQIMHERIPYIQKHVEALLKKDIDFSKDDKYETDSKKREYVSSKDALKERWRKLVKLEVLLQYFELKDEQDGINDDDKKKKKTKKKVAKKNQTKEQMIKSAKEKVGKRYKKIFARLMDEKHTDEMDKFYNSITRIYDPHTLYLVPEEKEDFDIDMSGKLQGIGALLREEGSYIKVERIIPGSASWRGKKLKAEDIILAVGQAKGDFVDIVDMSIRDAVKMIRGKKGSVVKLKVKKPDGSQEIIPIVRDEVVLEAAYVKSTIIEHKKLKQKIGYIHVPKFYRDFQDSNGRNSSEDVKQEIIKLKKKNVDGIVLNLRNNGGGALQDATLMGGLFIDEGPIVQVKSSGKAQVKSDVDGITYWDKPLIVLINRFSASASEIVAGALKDYNRAVIVGTSEQTHGKGTVQAILDLKNFVNPFVGQMLGPIGAMKITTDMFYRINGMSTQFRGIKPDIELPDPYGFLDSGEKSLEFAIPYAEVGKLKYKKWTKQKYDIEKLGVNSEKRVKKSLGFQHIVDSVKWSKSRKDESERSLNLDDMAEFRKVSRAANDKFKNDVINKDIVITKVQKLKNEVEKETFVEFQEELQKDPAIEEVLYIFNDMLKS